MRVILKVYDRNHNPLGWVEIGKQIFAFSQNLSAGNEFDTREEAIKFVAGSETNPQIEEVEKDVCA